MELRSDRDDIVLDATPLAVSLLFDCLSVTGPVNVCVSVPKNEAKDL